MWQITRDHLKEPSDPWPSRAGHGEDFSRVSLYAAIAGDTSEELPGDPLPRIPFRLKDDDGEVYYSGWLNDDDECLNQSAALDYGMADAGCTSIEVKRDDEWKVEIA